jgi:hypothetical protein
VVVILSAGSLQAVLARDALFAAAPGTYQLILHEQGQRLVAVMSLLMRNAINVVSIGESGPGALPLLSSFDRLYRCWLDSCSGGIAGGDFRQFLEVS